MNNGLNQGDKRLALALDVAGWGLIEIAIEVSGAAKLAIGHEGVVGDVTDANPAEILIKACGVAVGDGVEDQERLAAFAGGGFGGAHQGGAKAPAAGAAMDEHLGQIGAVGLVFGQVEDQLDGAAEAELVFGDEQGPFAGGDAGGDVAPEGDGTIARERVHETDGCAAVNAVDKDVGEGFDMGIVERVEAAEGAGERCHCNWPDVGDIESNILISLPVVWYTSTSKLNSR